MDIEPLDAKSPGAVDAILAGRVSALALATSGSTGTPRSVIVPRDAMIASAEATTARLGFDGQWLLCVPGDRIAGVMVKVRSALAGFDPVTMPQGPFTAEAFAHAVRTMTAPRRLVSLVPTQLERLLASQEGASALESFDAVLVGGAPTLRAKLPANVIRTYGSTETSGGCVYDGVPLDGVEVKAVEGRLRIAGPMLATGYSDGDNSSFVVEGARRWWVTSDIGSVTDGVVTVHGRADDVINSGGIKIHPAAVERAIASAEWVDDVVVVGVPDSEWGERAVALVASSHELDTDDATGAVAEVVALALPRHHIPKQVIVLTSLPRLESGKIDRRAARALAMGGGS